MSTITYIVREGDQLDRIAKSYGVTTQTLIAYNNLQWPYISNQPPSPPTPASGTVTITFPQAIGLGFTIPKGWVVGSALRGVTSSRQYVTEGDTKVSSGMLSINTTVECTVPGTFGNCAANQITKILTSGVVPDGTTITNPYAFTNGSNSTVLGPGSTLYVPYGKLQPSQQYTVYNPPPEIGGSDLAFDFNLGDLIIGPDGDYATTVGINNIATNIIGHLKTNYGDLLHHQSYGTDVMAVATSPSGHREKLMKLSITEALLAEPDVASVGTIKFSQVGAALKAEITVTLSMGVSTVIPMYIG